MRIAGLFLMGLILTAPAIAEEKVYDARLVRVVDGDTLRVDLDLGADITLKNQAIRILGIDAPELHGPERDRGRAAKAAAEKFLKGKKLRIELHGKDRYGRWLGDVFADGENLALWMIKAGQARSYELGRQRSG